MALQAVAGMKIEAAEWRLKTTKCMVRKYTKDILHIFCLP